MAGKTRLRPDAPEYFLGALDTPIGHLPFKRRMNYIRSHRLPEDRELRASPRCLAGQVLQPKAPGEAP